MKSFWNGKSLRHRVIWLVGAVLIFFILLLAYRNFRPVVKGLETVIDNLAYRLNDYYTASKENDDRARTVQIGKEDIDKFQACIDKLTKSDGLQYSCAVKSATDNGDAALQYYNVYENKSAFVKEYNGPNGAKTYKILKNGNIYNIDAAGMSTTKPVTSSDVEDVLGYIFRSGTFKIVSIQAESVDGEDMLAYTVILNEQAEVFYVNDAGTISRALYRNGSSQIDVAYTDFRFKSLDDSLFNVDKYVIKPTGTPGQGDDQVKATAAPYAVQLPDLYPQEDLPIYEGGVFTGISEDVNKQGKGKIIISISYNVTYKILVDYYINTMKEKDNYKRTEYYIDNTHSVLLSGKLKDWNVESLVLSKPDSKQETQVTITLVSK